MVDTFSLAQQRASTDVYIYPNGDLSSCTELTAYGINPNYACVDEVDADEDDTYVYSSASGELFDFYTLPDQALSGTINYIQVYTRAKSHVISQEETGIYKIICSPDSTCTHVYKSEDFDLITDYSDFSKVWTENPQSAATWTWGNIDDLSIGEECSSPTIIGASKTLTIRPNGVGAQNNLTPVGAGANWTCCDEDVANGYTDYVAQYTTLDRADSYTLANHTTETGVIDKVTVFAVIRSPVGGACTGAEYKTRLRVRGSYYTGSSEIPPPDTWTLISTDYLLNPDTTAAWTWAQIDLLEAGIWIEGTTCWYGACTQVYVVVHYTETSNPEIRTTQCHVKVNYLPSPVACVLNKPSKISYDHSRNIRMLNFWDGTREVYDLSRNSKSIVMTGEEFFQAGICNNACPCERIECIRTMGLNGSTVTISGFAGIRTLTNGEYKIRSFGWKKISDNTIHYEWILELESNIL